MIGFPKKKLGDFLLENGLINQTQLKEALIKQRESNKRLGKILIESGYVTQKEIAEMLELQLGIPFVNLETYAVESSAIFMIPENMARRHEIFAVKIENESIVVAVSDPFNTTAFIDIRIYTGLEVSPVLAGQTHQFIY